MKTVITILVALHGIIHLFGFLKAFGWVQFQEIHQPIPKLQGIVWLLAFLLFVLTVFLRFSGADNWWITAIIAIVVSQVIIIIHWQDAKYGTLLNLMILLVTMVAFSNQRFRMMVNAERQQILSEISGDLINNNAGDDLKRLPLPVQTWLTRSGVLNQEPIHSIQLTQDIRMKMKPEQKNWIEATATQVFTISPPAFNWAVDLKMNGFLDVAGRDQFYQGRGHMLIKLFSLFPMVNAKNSDHLDQATLQRYLAEIVWFPSATLSDYITWEHKDDFSAVATLNYQGVEGSGTFYFDEHGDFHKFVALRYKDVDPNAQPLEWTVIATKTDEFHGVRVPTEVEATWSLETGLWTWLNLRVKEVVYN